MTTEPDRLEVMQADLLPCPFCGGRATAWKTDDGSPCPSVWCRNTETCGAEVSKPREGLDAITAWNTRPIETNSRTGEQAEMGAAVSMSPDVIRLVIAARIVAFEDQSPEAMHELDKASEAFASRVPWDDEPAPAPQSITPPEVGGELERVAEALDEWIGDIGTSRDMARAAIAALSTPEVVDGTAGLVEALEKIERAKAGLARLFHGSEDATDRALADSIRFINAALSQHRRAP